MSSGLNNNFIKVMVVDDSAVVRGMTTRAIGKCPDIKVIATANNGQAAVDMIKSNPVDVVVLDLEMPVMDGMTALPLLLKSCPDAKIIISSTLTLNGATVSLKALSQGASDCIPKPTTAAANQNPEAAQEFFRDLTARVRALGEGAVKSRGGVLGAVSKDVPKASPKPIVKSPQKETPKTIPKIVSNSESKPILIKSPSTTRPPDRIASIRFDKAPAIDKKTIPASPPKPVVAAIRPQQAKTPDKSTNQPAKAAPKLAAMRFMPKALAIASSTGGPQALMEVMKGLNGKLSNVPIFITQHMPANFTTILAQNIGKASGKPSAEGKAGENVTAGSVYLAPGDYHMIAESKAGRVTLQLNQDPPVNFCRPAADPMIESLVDIYGNKLMLVVLTGMGHDGLEGAKKLHSAGGGIAAQDEESCVVWGMPRAISENNLCNAEVPLNDMADHIIKAFGG